MGTTISRIAAWLAPIAVALSLAPVAAMADEPQDNYATTGVNKTEQIQNPVTTEPATPGDSANTVKSSNTNAATNVAKPKEDDQQVKPEQKNGLVLENGELVSYDSGIEKAISGWQQFNGSWYWFDNSSKASKSEWIKTGGKRYRLGADGKMLTGTFSVDSSLYHAIGSGALITGSGWVEADGKWWYPDSNGSLRTGWLYTGGNWYWLDHRSGSMGTGWIKADDGKWYLMDESGSMLIGWQKRGAWYHLAPSGVMETGWLRSGGSWYWLDRDSGAMQIGWIKDDNGKWWFAEGSGALSTSARWVMGNGGSWYRIDSNGAMATGWRYVSDCWYWLDPSLNGEMAANKLVIDNGTYYWCDSSGAMIRNSWCKDDTWHWASGSGAIASGWIKAGGSWYWLDPSDPKHPMLTGLQTIDESDYFFKDSGAMVSTCWVKVDTTGNARFASSSGALGSITRDADGTLKNNGVLCSGWVNLGGGAKTYADPISHKAMTGWIKDGTETYYINPSSGVVSTGWEQINGAWYLFNYSGKMLTNWQKVGGNWYYMDSSGAMQTGWLKTGDTWYYLNGSGAMLTGWQWVGSNWYYMNGSGAMQTGWLKQGGTWYWLSGSGAMATGWQKIGGTWYYFDGSGAWVPNPERAQMTDRIWGCNSGTQWLIAVNRSTHKVGIYRGSSHNWSLQYYVDCVTGAPSSPTITGTFRTSGGKRMALSTDSRAKWCTQISGGYFFHTILASNNELGKSLSHGCIRMAYPDAQWIYNNIYAGTTVVIYG